MKVEITGERIRIEADTAGEVAELLEAVEGKPGHNNARSATVWLGLSKIGTVLYIQLGGRVP